MPKFLDENGRLLLARWAQVFNVELPEPTSAMYGTPARAVPLVSNGELGLDLIQLPAGGCFDPHTHPGDHLLIVVSGRGTITYDGVIYETEPGTVYLIEGLLPHAVGAITDHAILAVGAPHRQPDDADRMSLTEYQAVAAELGQLYCMACGRHVEIGDPDCRHAPQPRPRAKPFLVGLRVNRGQLAARLAVRPRELGRVADVTSMAVTDVLPSVVAGSLRGVLGGRVIVALDPVSARLLGAPGENRDLDAVVVTDSGAAPQLLINLPELLPRVRIEAVLRLACTLAASGPLGPQWAETDAAKFMEAVARADPGRRSTDGSWRVRAGPEEAIGGEGESRGSPAFPDRSPGDETSQSWSGSGS